MGWSATQDACKTLDLLTAASMANAAAKLGSPIQNVYYDKGAYFMWERGAEQDDGSITGQIFKYEFGGNPLDGKSKVFRAGSFKIDVDGNLVRGSAFLKAAAKKGASK